MTLVVDPLEADPVGVAKSAVSRGLAYVLAALLVGHLILARTRPASPVWLAVAAYVGAACVSAAFAVDTYSALFGAHRRYLGLTSIFDGVVLALAVAAFTRGAAAIRALAAALALSAAVVALYGLAQQFGDPLGITLPGRGSTIGNPGALAGYLVVVGSMLAAWLALSWPETGAVWRSTVIASGALAFGSALVTGARGPALALPLVAGAGLGAGLRVGVIRIGWVEAPRGRVALGAVALMLTGIFLISPAGSRLARLIERDTSSIERAVIYSTGVTAVKERPLFGAGPDGFATIYLALRPPESSSLGSVITPMQSSTHSWILHQAVGVGLVGLTAYVALAAVALRSAWRGVRTPAGAMGGIGIIAFLAQGLFNINHVAVEWLFWLSLGLVVVSEREASSDAPRRSAAQATGPLGALVCLGAGMVLASTVLGAVQASRLAHASNVARGMRDPGRAEELALRATQLDSGRADHWNVLGLARAGRAPEAAVRAFAEAARRAPYDATYSMNVARESFALFEKDPASKRTALEYASKAVGADPRDPQTHFIRGFILLHTDDAAGAAREAETAIGLRPTRIGDAFQAYFLAADAYKALNDPERALASLRAALALAEQSGHVSAPGLRLEVARYLRGLGRQSEVAALVPAPVLRSVDRLCGSSSGVIELPSVGKVSRCLRLLFDVGEHLSSGPARTDAADRRENYLIDGAALPAGAALLLIDGQPGAAVPTVYAIELDFPLGTTVPGRGAIVTVRGIADTLGNPIRPDPSSMSVREAP